MRIAPCVLAVVLAGTAAGCADPYGYRYGPNYASAPYGYRPSGYYSETYYPSDRYYYSSKWDYYRNYNGAVHPGPEHYP